MLNEISILLAFKEHEITIVYNDLQMDLKLHACALTETLVIRWRISAGHSLAFSYWYCALELKS